MSEPSVPFQGNHLILGKRLAHSRCRTSGMDVCADVLCKPCGGLGRASFTLIPRLSKGGAGYACGPCAGAAQVLASSHLLAIVTNRVSASGRNDGLGPLLVWKSVTESGFKALGFFFNRKEICFMN